jgi:hypothetical protein
MGKRHVPRVWMPILAAFLLMPVAASRPQVAELARAHSGDRAEAIDVPPFRDALLTGTDRLSVGEFSRGVERSRLSSIRAALEALGGLCAVAVWWHSSSRQPRRRPDLSSLRRIVGPRAPPPLRLA